MVSRSQTSDFGTQTKKLNLKHRLKRLNNPCFVLLYCKISFSQLSSFLSLTISVFCLKTKNTFSLLEEKRLFDVGRCDASNLVIPVYWEFPVTGATA